MNSKLNNQEFLIRDYEKSRNDLVAEKAQLNEKLKLS